MNMAVELREHDIAAFLEGQSHKPTLRFITCGSGAVMYWFGPSRCEQKPPRC